MAVKFAKPMAATPAVRLVEDIRRYSGLSQAELARRAGLPRSVVNVYLRGNREPGVDTLARLAAAGGLEIQLHPVSTVVDPERASRILLQVLELAEALPYEAHPELDYPVLAQRTLDPIAA